MRAGVLKELPTQRLVVEDVEDPVPDEGSVVVKVEACGICGTDLHVMAGTSYRPVLPFILGHEPVGVVTGVGPDVDERLLGQRVVPTIFVGCGKCRYCATGDERLCECGAEITGVLGRPGGFAEKLVLRSSQIVQVPAGVEALTAAALVDAGATAHNAARVVNEVGVAGGRHLIVGAGPVGLLTAEVLRLSGCELSIVEVSAARRAAADRLGYVVLGRLGEANGPFASVIDCAGDPGAVQSELDMLAAGGWLVVVGYGTVPELDLSCIARRELTVRGVRSGNRQDLETMLRLTAAGLIRAPEQETWSLEDINAAFCALRAGGVPGKAVIVVNGGESERH